MKEEEEKYLVRQRQWTRSDKPTIDTKEERKKREEINDVLIKKRESIQTRDR
jgi:hypothetical protein